MEITWVNKPFIDFDIDDDRAVILYAGAIREEVMVPVDYGLLTAYRKGVKGVNLYIDSLGGDPFVGISLYHLLNAWKRRGLEICTGIYGKVASAAVIPFMAGSHRVAHTYSMLMIHDMKMFIGQYPFKSTTEQESDARNCRKIQSQIDKLIHSNLRPQNLPLEDIAALCKQDCWMIAEEAKQYGFIDEIIE